MSNDDLKMYIKKHIDEIEDSSLLLFIYKLIINLISLYQLNSVDEFS